MGTIVEFDIDEEVADKFNVALLLNKEAGNYLIEQFMKKYITLSFKEAAQAFRPDTQVTPENINMIRTTSDEYKGKAIDKIPKWAMRPEQNNHKIIRAFFQLVREQGNVYYNDLEARCSNKENYLSTYMEKFKPNFDQMKIDAIKSNGKVFQVNKGTEEVTLWDFIEPRLMEYKHYFE